MIPVIAVMETATIVAIEMDPTVNHGILET